MNLVRDVKCEQNDFLHFYALRVLRAPGSIKFFLILKTQSYVIGKLLVFHSTFQLRLEPEKVGFTAPHKLWCSNGNRQEMMDRKQDHDAFLCLMWALIILH